MTDCVYVYIYIDSPYPPRRGSWWWQSHTRVLLIPEWPLTSSLIYVEWNWTNANLTIVCVQLLISKKYTPFSMGGFEPPKPLLWLRHCSALSRRFPYDINSMHRLKMKLWVNESCGRRSCFKYSTNLQYHNNLWFRRFPTYSNTAKTVDYRI